MCLLSEINDKVKRFLQRKSNELYDRLSPKNRGVMTGAYRGSKRVRGGVASRAPQGKLALKKLILGGDTSFTKALINEPGKGRNRVKKVVAGKSAGTVKIVKEKK